MVKHILGNLPIHTMSIYRWPKTTIQESEKSLRNFFWSGDTEKKKTIVVAWQKICLPKDGGEIGISSLGDMNRSLNMKLAWADRQATLPMQYS